MTPEQLEICKRIFKPLVWQPYERKHKTEISFIGKALTSFGIYAYEGNNTKGYWVYLNNGAVSSNTDTPEKAQTSAEQHYYETLGANVDWAEFEEFLAEQWGKGRDFGKFKEPIT